MIEFKVHGPFRIKTIKKASARVLNPDTFWADKRLHHLATQTGAYVFAIKPSRVTAFTPYYVGRATKVFEREVFTPDKLLKYYNALAQFKKGYPAFFFVATPRKKGPVNKKAISEVESYFTQLGFLVNPSIENVQGTKLPNWSVGGLIRSKARKISRSAKEFAAMFELGAS